MSDSSSRPVKFYTRARKFPRLLGTTMGGKRVPGGPYTIRQIALGVAVLVVATKTSEIWGASIGGISRVILIATATISTVVLTRNLPTFTRNPLHLIAGVLRVITGPATGRRVGKPIRLPRINTTGGVAMVDDSPLSPPAPTQPQPPLRAVVRRDESTDLGEGLRRPEGAASTSSPSAPPPPGSAVATPGLSRVSELLAAAAAGNPHPPTSVRSDHD